MFSFRKIILSIKERGFDEKNSIIPIDQYNKIIDGSHRLGASIVLNKKMYILVLRNTLWVCIQINFGTGFIRRDKCQLEE